MGDRITALDRVRVGGVRRDREVNWGDKTRITGDRRVTLASVSVEESRALTLYASATVHGDARFSCVVTVEWGHGGASIAQSYPVIHRLVVPLAASMVSASGRLLDVDGKPAPSSVSADVTLVIAPGIDTHAIHNTTWITRSGASGAVTTEPTRLVRLEALNLGAADVWLMLFDGAPVVGASPRIVRRAPVGRTVTVRRPDSQGFARGLSFAASTAPDVFAPTAVNRVLRIDAEILQ